MRELDMDVHGRRRRLLSDPRGSNGLSVLAIGWIGLGSTDVLVQYGQVLRPACCDQFSMV